MSLMARRYDVGEKLGFIQTTFEFALKRSDLGDDVAKMMEELLAERASRLRCMKKYFR